tara:strand:- start:9933 stop:10841 length:909 start_codon:yes stop_codon:yes gene_type:complete
MKRRCFLQQSMVLGAGITIAPSVLATSSVPENFEKLTILHTNDTHSNIETFPADHAKYPNQGGVARRYSLIKQIRSQEKNVLLLDAGDIFQGTPYFNKFHGTLEMKLMSQMGYDCATMGNHDFDAGLDGFLNAYQHADFPFVCSNYDFTNTQLKDVTKPYQIFQKGPFKVGIFGLGVGLEGLVPKVHYGDTIHQEPIPIANKMAKFLRFEEDCDLVICLSHLGYYPKQFEDCDTLLAAETENIDLIIGGHTHTFLDRPEVHKNKIGEKVLINQVGWAGLALGRIDFYLGEKKKHERHRLVMV